MSNNIVLSVIQAHIAQTVFWRKQMMVKEWERICFMQQELTKIQHWMISKSASTGARWVHQNPGVVVEGRGEGLEVSRCSMVKYYRIILNRRVRSTCYRDFPVVKSCTNVTYFPKIIERHLTSTCPSINCSDRPTHTYLKDIRENFYLIDQFLSSRRNCYGEELGEIESSLEKGRYVGHRVSASWEEDIKSYKQFMNSKGREERKKKKTRMAGLTRFQISKNHATTKLPWLEWEP